ncbi:MULTISPECIES: penicillin-binding transpeptidase domain-containing protein [unclassified Butyrivibrio]|uniref:penicillin-binding transpeptidase domain-containing protein n=1 Tax=unclassified Butyrivibrio TaxID=2639466 RepID=UPI0004217715|nr:MULTISPECIES: penicillin-binding transpeptidase domain-containing protein [unclassified Butyrivibrio]
MFNKIKEVFINFITSRLVMISAVMILAASGLVYRLFYLQIIRGETYLDSFQLKIMKEKSIPAARGNIYDRNGKLLAYNELSNSVTIEDVYESGSGKNAAVNETVNKVIDIIEKDGDVVDTDFSIQLNSSNNFEFTVEGNSQLRFLADVYGRTSTKDLKYEERSKTAQEVIDDLCEKFGIGDYTEPGNKKSFVPGMGYEKDRLLKLVIVRFKMNSNSYQKYINTVIANSVSDKTVADIMENSNILDGVSIEEDTARVYVDSVYFSQILGYTGKISDSELTELQAQNSNYRSNDTVGKSGIEQSMESVLQGTKGSETVFVDNTGKVLETSSYIDSKAGNDVYLTIDKDLQEACYNIIEQSLAGILISKIQNTKFFIYGDNIKKSDIQIPVYDVYFACFDNHIIDLDHMASEEAGRNEKLVYEHYLQKRQQVNEELRAEFTTKNTPYNLLSNEYKVYMSYIAQKLYSNGVIDSSKVDKEDKTYIAWTTDETISLSDYIKYCISANWIDVTLLNLESQYVDSEEIYNTIIDYIFKDIEEDSEFNKKLYKYLLSDDIVTGDEVCSILLEQGIVELPEEELSQWNSGSESPYTFMINRISALDITPAQLALDPCSGSMVVTDVNNGDVLALVSYPGYDNNKMANGVDAEYYAKLRSDQSSPLINYATMQRTAPGSTYKMVSATAGLMEGVIDTSSTITCTGVFDKLDNTNPAHCWIYPRAHGSLDVVGGIRNSCNAFFFEVGYRLGLVGENFHSDTGLEKLATYADMYGLSEKTGIEISEYEPIVSDLDSTRSAIGQGTNSFTTVGLARYVTTVANSGTCYNLTLVKKTSDSDGNLLQEYGATVRNHIDMDSSYWNAIHLGMRQVVEDKPYFNDLAVNVAGKTGTAEESKKRANHALFVCYAPYEAPQIAIATRIAYGYTSSYAAQITKEAVAYYFGLKDPDDVQNGTAQQLEGGDANAD